MQRFVAACVALSGVVLLSRQAIGIPAPQWLESGVNLIWVQDAGPDAGNDVALTIGRGRGFAPDRNDFSLTGLSPPYEQFNPVPLTDAGSDALDAGRQVFCYVVDGNVAVTSQAFLPNDYSFACSNTTPYLDLSPSAILTMNGNFTVNTWDAGFVGSIFRLDAGSGWQPWFRNGEEVLFDMPAQAPVDPADAGNYPLNQLLPPIDPGFYTVATVSFTSTAMGPQTIELPQITGMGDVIELQITNESGIVATCPMEQIVVEAVYPGADQTPTYIGEATVGPIDVHNAAGSPRLSTYRLNTSDNILTGPVASVTLEVPTPIVSGQAVTVAVVIHGYHEPIK